MKALVTGSQGLVGSALKRLLGSDHVYHARTDADLRNESETTRYIAHHVQNSGVDTLIHCAAKVGGVLANMNNNEQFFMENYLINNNVLKSCFATRIPTFVNLLSTCIYPAENVTYPLTAKQIDAGPPHPSNYGYSYAKRLSGYETNIFRNVLKKRWINIVPTNVYGPDDNFNLVNSHIIPGMIHRCLLAKKTNEPLAVWGDGTQLRQFIHADDLAKAIVWAINNWESPEHFMAINEREYSVREVALAIANAFDLPERMIQFDESKPKGIHRKPAVSDIPRSFSFIPLEQGIQQTAQWFSENFATARK